MRTWQLQEAKAHLSQLAKEAMQHGPHFIKRKGGCGGVVKRRV